MSKRVRFNYELLKELSENYGFNFSNNMDEHYTRDTIIKGSCITLDCNGIFEKQFGYIYQYERYYCQDCISKMKKIKLENTNLERYGSIYSSQNDEVKKKNYNTNKNKSESEKQEINMKRENTNMESHGVKTAFEIEGVKEKIENTNLERYGAKNPFQSEELKQKIIETNIKKYGVKNPSQNAEIAQKNKKNAYKLKDYIFPSGKIIQLQGYEHHAINKLLNEYKIKEEDIFTDYNDVPEIWYMLENIEHRHYVDIYIKSLNKCIEVKSEYTWKKDENKNKQKQIYANKLGYIYEFWIFNEKGTLLNVIA